MQSAIKKKKRWKANQNSKPIFPLFIIRKCKILNVPEIFMIGSPEFVTLQLMSLLVFHPYFSTAV